MIYKGDLDKVLSQKTEIRTLSEGWMEAGWGAGSTTNAEVLIETSK